jgi:hypothetical protein
MLHRNPHNFLKPNQLERERETQAKHITKTSHQWRIHINKHILQKKKKHRIINTIQVNKQKAKHPIKESKQFYYPTQF